MDQGAADGATGNVGNGVQGELKRREQAAGLWPIQRALAVASVTAVVGLVAVMMAVLGALGFPHLQPSKVLPISQLLDMLKLVLGTVAGVGALFALVMAYRRQRVAEVAELREHQRARDDLTRVFNERFGAASAQLGHDEPAVRLAGAYAMAGLADDWEQGRQTCIDVLCAFLRLPYAPDPGETPIAGQDAATHAEVRAAYRAAREVRHTVIRIIGNHLNGHTDVSWRGHDLDFTDVVFDGGDFRDAVFTAANVSFMRARFVSDTVIFIGAQFEAGSVLFSDARFEEGTVDFSGARFRGGTVTFVNARLQGALVVFDRARFEADRVVFGHARFRGGAVDFDRAEFRGGEVIFDFAEFEGTRFSFDGATGRRPSGLPDGMADHLA